MGSVQLYDQDYITEPRCHAQTVEIQDCADRLLNRESVETMVIKCAQTMLIYNCTINLVYTEDC